MFPGLNRFPAGTLTAAAHLPHDQSRNVTQTLRDFCGSRLCSVVLRRALGSICNGHPASEVVENQIVTIDKTPLSMVRLASNQGVRGSNPFGRTFYQKLRQMPLTIMTFRSPQR